MNAADTFSAPAAELRRLRETLCSHIHQIDDLSFLHALQLLHEAWFDRARRPRPLRDRLAVRLPHPPRLVVAWALVLPYISG